MADQFSNCQELAVGMAYVPMQKLEKRYSDDVAIIRGTIFPDLDLPFLNYVNNCKLPETCLNEVMKNGFVCFDLRLYLDTHPDETEVWEYYDQCCERYEETKRKYESELHSIYGKNRARLEAPWPWE